MKVQTRAWVTCPHCGSSRVHIAGEPYLNGAGGSWFVAAEMRCENQHYFDLCLRDTLAADSSNLAQTVKTVEVAVEVERMTRTEPALHVTQRR